MNTLPDGPVPVETPFPPGESMIPPGHRESELSHSHPLTCSTENTIVKDAIDTEGDPFFDNASEDEDEWLDPDTGGVPLKPKRIDQSYDEHKCPLLTVVDITGIHQLRTRFCQCLPLKQNPLHQQLLNMGLYHSTTARTRTAFTFRVLEDFDLSNLEGKVTALKYYDKLKRLTFNAFPHMVPDRYRELMRALRQWRDLAARRRAGLPFESGESLKPGGLALFCPACPQPGVNLPEGWEKDSEK